MSESANPEPKIIEEGHELTDVSCRHGSRWIWWPGPTGRGKWECVVSASNCNCGEPPRPFKRKKLKNRNR
jgi:hypothetical protein